MAGWDAYIICMILSDYVQKGGGSMEAVNLPKQPNALYTPVRQSDKQNLSHEP